MSLKLQCDLDLDLSGGMYLQKTIQESLASFIGLVYLCAN